MPTTKTKSKKSPETIALEDMSMGLSTEELKAYVAKLPQATQDNVVIVRNEGQPLMNLNYHEKTALRCSLSKRAHPSEEKDTPRVYTCPTLAQCLSAFGEHKTLFTGHAAQAEGATLDWYRGGAYIYHLYDWEVALKPNDKLVYDSTKTDETWLVDYNGANSTYGVVLAGKLFMRSVVFQSVEKAKKPSALEEWFIQVVDKQGMMVDDKTYALPGYWRMLRLNNRVISMENLTVAQYKAAKDIQASMLSYVHNADTAAYPAVFGW